MDNLWVAVSLVSHMKKLPAIFNTWLDKQGWSLRPHQKAMIEAFGHRRHSLLIAPTGAGKTLAGFIPSLIDLADGSYPGLHTLYISPLKALTNDIQRNLTTPIEEMGLPVTVESRTGDTPSHKRVRQRQKPPNILLTTPESLMLMLSYADAPQIFGKVKLVIIDEVHSFAHNKRGDFTSLALARLSKLTPDHVRFGLSATVALPDQLAQWLVPAGQQADTIIVKDKVKPKIEILEAHNRLPYSGFMAKYAMDDILARIKQADTSIIFVNTRAQAEFTFQMLWEKNSDNLPIGIYHGSLSREQRRKTEEQMADGKLRAVVSTSALELGIDWGDVDLVMQLGAPKGVSRLLQRIGRSNHRMDEPSEAILVPTNRFEMLECMAATKAIANDQLDGEPLLPGSLDVVVQYIVNCACSEPIRPDEIYAEVISTYPYRELGRATFDQLYQFAKDGGYVLRHYEQFARLAEDEDGYARIASQTAARRHRQNIGTIVEATRLNVRKVGRGRGQTIGQVEESFAQQLNPGDTFFFAGQVLEYIGIRDMALEARSAKASEAKVPSYAGGQMPLSTFLADGVRAMLTQPRSWTQLPPNVKEWLQLQKAFSVLPTPETLLIEHFPRDKRFYTIIYSFEGRRANQTLGMLITKRMEHLRLKPLSFSVTDYALSISSLVPIDEVIAHKLVQPDILGDQLEEWIVDSPMLKRSFRHVAMITGLTQQRQAGDSKTMKQVTFSTDLIYDVLRKYEPNHILLQVTRDDAERELLDVARLSAMLNRFEGELVFRALDRASPLSIPILLDVRREHIGREGVEALLEAQNETMDAEQMMDDVRDALR